MSPLSTRPSARSAPVLNRICSEGFAHNEQGVRIVEKLEKAGFRVELDDRSEKIGYKIREAQLQKIPYMLIIGDKEVQSNTIGVRSRKAGDLGAIAVDEFIEKVKVEVESYER